MKITIDAAVVQQALDALELRCGTNAEERLPTGAIAALRAAIEQAESVPPTSKYTQPSAWWRLSAYPECLPCATTDPEEAQQWRMEGHDVRELVEQAEGQEPVAVVVFRDCEAGESGKEVQFLTDIPGGTKLYAHAEEQTLASPETSSMNTPPKLTEKRIEALARVCEKFLRSETEVFEHFNRLQFARAIEAARDAQWLEHLKSSGWRQCAEGQGVSQSCAQAEELAKKLQAVEAQRDELRDAHEACKAANTLIMEEMAAITKAQASEPAPKREWVGLTDEQAWVMWEAAVFVANKTGTLAPFNFARNIAAKLKELNHG
jgi:hypothetical protein